MRTNLYKLDEGRDIGPKKLSYLLSNILYEHRWVILAPCISVVHFFLCKGSDRTSASPLSQVSKTTEVHIYQYSILSDAYRPRTPSLPGVQPPSAWKGLQRACGSLDWYVTHWSSLLFWRMFLPGSWRALRANISSNVIRCWSRCPQWVGLPGEDIYWGQDYHEDFKGPHRLGIVREQSLDNTRGSHSDDEKKTYCHWCYIFFSNGAWYDILGYKKTRAFHSVCYINQVQS